MAKKISKEAAEAIKEHEAALEELRSRKQTKQVKKEIETCEEIIKSLSTPGWLEEVQKAEAAVDRGDVLPMPEAFPEYFDAKGNYVGRQKGGKQ